MVSQTLYAFVLMLLCVNISGGTADATPTISVSTVEPFSMADKISELLLAMNLVASRAFNESCGRNVCYCQNGEAAMGFACEANNTADCAKCDSGYHLKNCTVAQSLLDTDGSCTDSIPLSGSQSCHPYEGQCQNGKLVALAQRVQENHCGMCAAGYYLENRKCLPCAAGSFQSISDNTNGSASCAECSAGSYADQSASRQCVICPAGSQCDAGAVDPLLCMPGKYQPSTGSSSCMACPAGSQCTAGAVNHALCAAGKYQNLTGRENCTSCPPGKFANQTGLRACIFCQPGRYQSNYQSTECLACPAGTQSTAKGSVKCNNVESFNSVTQSDDGSIGGIVGGAVAGIIVVIVVTIVAVVISRKKKRSARKVKPESHGPKSHTAPHVGDSSDDITLQPITTTSETREEI